MKRARMYQKAGLILAGLACAAGAAWGQASIYRCGNEYINNSRQAKERGCKAVEGGHVTVIHGGGSAASSAVTSTPTPTPRGAVAPPRPTPPRTEGAEQKARDGDAKAILQAELDKANARLSALKAEFNDGYPERSALELRNPQYSMARTDELKANIARQESDIAGIQRELARLP